MQFVLRQTDLQSKKVLDPIVTIGYRIRIYRNGKETVADQNKLISTLERQ